MSRVMKVHSAAIYLCPPDSRALLLDGQEGFHDSLGELFGRIPLDEDLPLSHAHENGVEIELYLDGRDPTPPVEVLLGRHPELDGGRIQLCPLLRRGKAHGVLALADHDGASSLSWQQRTFREGAASAVSIWGWTRLMSPDVAAPRRDDHGMTGRQRSILLLVERGYTNERIGRSLGYSTSTVKAELARMFRMTSTSRREQLLVVARRMGWLTALSEHDGEDDLTRRGGSRPSW